MKKAIGLLSLAVALCLTFVVAGTAWAEPAAEEGIAYGYTVTFTPDQEPSSVIELPAVMAGGQSALLISSAKQSSEQSIGSFPVSALQTIFSTDLSLHNPGEGDAQHIAYLGHSKGSTVLVKSTDVELILSECELRPDPEGTGALIQTVINDDLAGLNAVPDGETSPGVVVTMTRSNVSGGIVHEDYQRDLLLTLTGSLLNGYLDEYDCAHWNQAAAEEGFADLCPDASYETHHGLEAMLQNGAVWNVTKESHLSKLVYTQDSQVNGRILVNGEERENKPWEVYEGDVVVLPLSAEDAPADAKEQETTTAAVEIPTEHEHTWVSNGGSPPDCTHEGKLVYVCTVCGEETVETTPALGHHWYWSEELSQPATCVKDGIDLYTCERCGEFYEEKVPAEGHKWHIDSLIYATCTTWGEEYYSCGICGETGGGEIPPLGHHWEYIYYDDAYHYYQCSNCGEWMTEPHELYDPCWCGHTGPVG